MNRTYTLIDAKSKTWQVTAVNLVQAIERVTDQAFAERLQLDNDHAQQIILATDIERFKRALVLAGVSK